MAPRIVLMIATAFTESLAGVHGHSSFRRDMEIIFLDIALDLSKFSSHISALSEFIWRFYDNAISDIKTLGGSN